MSEQNNIGAIICPNCRKLISASAETCMHCGMKNPNLWGLGTLLRRIFGGHFSFVPIISMVCVTFFGISLLIAPPRLFSGSLLGILTVNPKSLAVLGATGSYAVGGHYWWTLITAIYLHGSLLHIIFNVMWIRQLGPMVEELFGISRSFLIYTISGVAGFVISNYVGVPFTIGASGSIFGLLGALIYYGRKRGGTFGRAVYRQLGQWAIVIFIFGFVVPGINNWAHGAGFAGGYLSAAGLGYIEIKRENRSHLIAAAVAVALTVLAFIMVFINGPSFLRYL